MRRRNPHDAGEIASCDDTAVALAMTVGREVIIFRALDFNLHVHLHVRGRNCDRAVERSVAFEALDQDVALFGANAAEGKVYSHRAKECHVGGLGAPVAQVALNRGVDRG